MYSIMYSIMIYFTQIEKEYRKMKRQKNFRLDEFTIMRIEEMAENLSISESQTIQLASLVMISLLKESDDSTRTVTELKENLMKRVHILKGEE